MDEVGGPELLVVTPVLPATDYAASLAYYRDRLGFQVAWEWGDPPFRAGVRRNAVELQLVCDPVNGPTLPASLYTQVRGVDGLYHECVRRGALVTRELGPRPWGMKDFQVVDPSGNSIGFGEAL